MKKFFLFTVFATAFLLKSNAQVATSFYTSINFSKIGIGYEFSEKMWTDLRIYGGMTINDFTIEPVIAYNFVTKQDYDAYAGARFIINYKTGPVLPMGIRIKPFEQNRKFIINLELEPNYNLNSEEIVFYCSVGVRYILK